MELRNESSAVKITVPQKPPSLEQQPEVVRTRKTLLIFIGILFVLCFINFMFVIHSLATSSSNKDQPPNSSSQLVSILIAFVYYGFGVLVTYRYYQTGLLAVCAPKNFAWLGFVSLLLMLAVVIVILIGVIITTSHLGFVKGILVGVIFIVICLAASLLQIFAVRYAFRLSKLLRSTKRFTIEQI
ncbi:unnamed protein product [Adineta ricciae]|uniref:Uncharacterized protein n=1 Tax=Adineta ricciae TaxID=249248 RepID=A0A814PJB8_ADIRI|nr:unnamed protein product [Adineta ricciae]